LPINIIIFYPFEKCGTSPARRQRPDVSIKSPAIMPVSNRSNCIFFAGKISRGMKANGENRDSLQRCSCSIDVIASVISYDHYVAAETYKSMGMVPGENGALFRESAPAKASITELKRAQAEADIRCF
jgi:hypothetical protein